MVDKDLLRKCKEDFDLKLPVYQQMREYYDSNTDAKNNYVKYSDRPSIFADNNFVQKFIGEESNYVCANKITYSSFTNNKDEINIITNNFKEWKEGHNKELLKQALIYQEAYELYYIENKIFKAMICMPQDSYILQDDYSNVELFIRFFYKKFDDSKTLYADVYTPEDIVHYTVMGTDFIQIPGSEIDKNNFGKVPVGICCIGDITESIFYKIKGLQDGYQTNLSDNINVNSEIRQEYLLFKGFKINEEKDDSGLSDADRVKKSGIIQDIPDSADAKFIERAECSYDKTLNRVEDDIYQQANHINWNTKLQSNTSSLALKNQMIGLNQKVGDDIQAIVDCIKSRLQFLFNYIYSATGINYDWKDIDIKTTPNVPSDDMTMAQICSQMNGAFPRKEMYKLFSFFDNPDQVEKEWQDEQKANNIGAGLLDTGGVQ